MKKLFAFFTSIFRGLFPIFFPSQLRQMSLMPAALGVGGFNPYPRGRFQYYGRTNGASRKGRSNRLQMSRNTINRQRRRVKH